MPELPEVETVRRGLEEKIAGRELGPVAVAHPRTVRRQPGGAGQFAADVRDVTVSTVHRRGKYLWLVFDGSDRVLVAHLGMSGQFRIVEDEPGHDPHARAWWPLTGGGNLVFRDQRTFGWLMSDQLAGDAPGVVAHIGHDPFEEGFDRPAAVRALRRKRSGIKRVLLDQTVVSGIGNIYADEALWRARMHPERRADRLDRAAAERVLVAAETVMSEAIEAGGTSFDPLYVAVNGESGWFERNLEVYGRDGEPCSRCGATIVRERFTNRSSHRCPRCQPAPRRS